MTADALFMLQTAATATLPDSTLTKVTFDTAVIDNEAGWSSGDHSKWVVPAGQAGLYALWANVPVKCDSLTSLEVMVEVRVNGTTAVILDSRSSIRNQVNGVHTTVATQATETQLVTLAEGDYIQVLAKQYTGAAATIDFPVTVVGKIVAGAPAFQLERANTSQTLPNNSNTPVTFDTAVQDDDGGWDATNKAHYVVPSGNGGLYILWGSASSNHGTAGSVDSTRRLVAIRVNGATLDWSDSRYGPQRSPNANTDCSMTTSGPVLLADGDFIELVVRADSTLSGGKIQPGASLSGLRFRDGGYGTDPGAFMNRVANQNFPNGTNTPVSWDTVVSNANAGGAIWSSGAPTRFTVQADEAGWYICWTRIQYSASAASNNGRRSVSFRTNGGTPSWANSRPSLVDVNACSVSTWGIVHLNVGDYMEVIGRADGIAASDTSPTGIAQMGMFVIQYDTH